MHFNYIEKLKELIVQYCCCHSSFKLGEVTTIIYDSATVLSNQINHNLLSLVST